MKSTKIKFTYLTLFPDLIKSYFDEGLLARALREGILEHNFIQLRDYSKNKYRSVDGKSYGGGDGMVLNVEPVVQAIENVRNQLQNSSQATGSSESQQGEAHVICLTPQGRVFNQSHAERLAEKEHVVFVCGRYAGFDQRIEYFCDESFSIGDYILSGGELPALVITEAIMRYRPGFLGNQLSAHKDSFSVDAQRLEAPQFSEPVDFRGLKVPSVLLSGHHQKIEQWKRSLSLIVTYIRRPDLITKESISKEEAKSVLKFLNDELGSVETLFDPKNEFENASVVANTVKNSAANELQSWLGPLMNHYQFSLVDLQKLQTILKSLL